MLDPNWAPTTKRSKKNAQNIIPVALMDAWDDPAVLDPAIVQRKKNVPRPRRIVLPNEPVVSSESSTTTTTSNSDCSSSDNGGEPLPDEEKQSSADSSSSTSSSSASDILETPAIADANKRRRVTDNRIPFGICWLTERFCARTKVLKSYQMTCMLRHNLDGDRCTREFNVSRCDGNAEMARRVLKTWALWGLTVDSRKDHRSQFDMIFCQMKNLMTEQELDQRANEILLESALDDDKQIDVPCGLRMTDTIENMPTKGILGKKARACPESVHQKMCEMAAAKKIPISTLETRQACKKSTTAEMGVPAGLKEARDWAYIHPNLPPPAGMVWRFRSKRWFLTVRGG